MGTVVSIQRKVIIEITKEQIFKDLNKAIDKLKQIPELQKVNGEWDKDLVESIGIFFQAYFSFKKINNLSYDLIQKCQCEAGQSLSKSRSISVVCKVVMEGLKMGYRDKAGKLDTHQFKVISESLHTLVNYSDCTPEVTYDIAGEPNFLETMKEILTEVLPNHLQDKAKVEDEDVMKCCLTIYDNISMVDDNILHLRSLDIVPVFLSFLDTQVQIYRLTALSTLANIINEEESTEILQGKPNVIAFLLKKLGLALKDPCHSHMGWSAQKCARTVHRLARTDANKTLLVEMNCLTHLVELAKSGNVDEQREAVGAIQVLSFHKDNQIKILYDTKLKVVDVLRYIKETTSDKVVRKAVEVTFWNLQEELQKNKYKNLVSLYEQKNGPSAAAMKSEESHGVPVKDGKVHILISYEQSNQEMLIKIRDILKDDYVVHMNNDNTIEVMAKAVEEAHVILMCMSRKYKYNPHCQAEIEYAFQLKKRIIPVIMERGYRPDGWLGLLLGTRIFFDFSGKYPLEQKIIELKHEIAYFYRHDV
ncbi:hypothetical protein ACJMK2_004578 [Sinanodonta woodiana]|uniref:TIR domain-containing protein n=1 Tax=Sinanodonta woodiana TaxID=1069815 RepID=A0ABD3Y1K7_SINWO